MFKPIINACKYNTIFNDFYWQYKDQVNLLNENWKLININGSNVNISSMGRVQLKFKQTSRILDSNYVKDGQYFRVRINKKWYGVHRLVCVAFKNFDIKSKFIINHIDGNKKNDKVENLEITTHKKNLEHAYKTGLRSRKNTINATRVARYDLDGSNEKIYDSVNQAGKDNNADVPTICKVCKNKGYKTTAGYIWKYVN